MSFSKTGWAWPLNSRKAHWFGADGRSLCGKWMFLGEIRDDSNHDSPDNCKACARKRKAKEPTNDALQAKD